MINKYKRESKIKFCACTNIYCDIICVFVLFPHATFLLVIFNYIYNLINC